MRGCIGIVLWLVLVGTAVNKAIDSANGNVGLAVVLTIVFVVVGTLVLEFLLLISWAIADKFKEWTDY